MFYFIFYRHLNRTSANRTSLIKFLITFAQSNIHEIEFFIDALNQLLHRKITFLYLFRRTLKNPNIITVRKVQQAQQIMDVKRKLSMMGQMFNNMLLAFSTFCAETQGNIVEKEDEFLQLFIELNKVFIFGLIELDAVVYN